jgi:hypothetical protein
MRYIDYMAMIFRRISFTFLILTALILPINAQSFKEQFLERFSWSINGNILFFPADNGVDSDPFAILPSLGASASLDIWEPNLSFMGPFAIELTQDFYFKDYEWNIDKGYAMACNPENRSAFVFSFLTGIQARAIFHIGQTGMRARANIGPAFDFRIVTLAFGLNHPDDFKGDDRDARIQTDKIRSYFWGQGRWIFFTAGGGMDFSINEKFLLGFDTRVWMPAYRLWTDEDLPKIDGWRFGIGFRITPRY